VGGQARRVQGSMSNDMAKPGGRSKPRVWRWEPVSKGVGGEARSEGGSGRGLALATVMLCPWVHRPHLGGEDKTRQDQRREIRGKA
jgi:hypothetical protein